MEGIFRRWNEKSKNTEQRLTENFDKVFAKIKGVAELAVEKYQIDINVRATTTKIDEVASLPPEQQDISPVSEGKEGQRVKLQNITSDGEGSFNQKSNQNFEGGKFLRESTDDAHSGLTGNYNTIGRKRFTKGGDEASGTGGGPGGISKRIFGKDEASGGHGGIAGEYMGVGVGWRFSKDMGWKSESQPLAVEVSGFLEREI